MGLDVQEKRLENYQRVYPFKAKNYPVKNLVQNQNRFALKVFVLEFRLKVSHHFKSCLKYLGVHSVLKLALLQNLLQSLEYFIFVVFEWYLGVLEKLDQRYQRYLFHVSIGVMDTTFDNLVKEREYFVQILAHISQ